MRLPLSVAVLVFSAMTVGCDRHDAAVFGNVVIGGRTTNGTVQVIDADHAESVMRPICLHYDSVIAPMSRKQAMLAGSSDLAQLQQQLDLLRLLQAQYKAFAPRAESAMARIRVGRAPIAGDGHFSIGGLPKGRYAILVNTEYGSQSLTAWKLIELHRGTWQRIDIGDQEVVSGDPLCPRRTDAAH